jgi:hypothetical protein
VHSACHDSAQRCLKDIYILLSTESIEELHSLFPTKERFVAFICPPRKKDVIMSAEMMDVTQSSLDQTAQKTLHHEDHGWEFQILKSLRETQPGSMPEDHI